MKRRLGTMILTAALVIASAGLVIRGAPASASPAGAQPQENTESKKEPKPAADGPARIQGKTIDEWLAALKDRDPAVRERAVEVLGERAFDPTLPPNEKSRLLTAAQSLLFSDPDREVRSAAAFFTDLERLSASPERVKQALEERKKAVKPTQTPIRLVDLQGHPVKGAVVGTYFQRDADREASFAVPPSIESATSDERGELALKLTIPTHLDAAGIYAMRPDGERPFVGLQRVSREEILDGKPVTVVMQPACRVRLRVECPGLAEIAQKYHADIGAGDWWRAAYVWLGENHRAPRPLFTCSTTGQLEFLLPPGRFLIMAYGSDVTNEERTIEVTPGRRLLSLGDIEVSPSEAIKKGQFRGYWRSIRRDPRAAANDADAAEQISFRRPRYGTRLSGETLQIQDLAYSPDGTLLATAHWYNAVPGEVKLWDTRSGKLIGSLPVASKDAGVLALRFSPDGKVLAGSVGVLPKSSPPGVVVLWDVAGRRVLKSLEGHTARVTALAFAPDGRSLASGGEDRTVRFWDVASGSETHRIDGNPGWVRSVAYAPDGKSLAIGSGTTLKLWDVARNRPGPLLAAEGFVIQSLAFAPDGKTLAAAGRIQAGAAQVRLFDLAAAPPARRAELAIHHEKNHPPNDLMSDVAFTPDGQRVAAVAMQTIVIWDAMAGDVEESLDRHTGSSADRLAISPDGRWLTVSGPIGSGLSTFDISPPRP
jgi:WD40 repeat protein